MPRARWRTGQAAGWARRSLRSRGVLMLALPALAMLVAITGLFALENRDAGHTVTLERLDTADLASAQVLRLLLDAETGVRGYLVTGDRQFLAPVTEAEPQLPAALRRLRTALRQLPVAGGGTAVANLATTELGQLQVLQAQPAGPASGPRTAAALAAKATMDAVRSQVNEIQTRDAALRSVAQSARNSRVAWINRATVALAALALLVGIGLSSWLMAGIVRRIRRVEENARRLAAGEPLLPLERPGSDEVAALARSLESAAELIRAGRERLNLALTVGRISIWEVDAAGRMRRHGEHATEHETNLQDALGTLVPAHASTLRTMLDQTRADGQPRDYEVESARDGRWFAGRVLRAAPTEVIAVAVDVTALRAAQHALRESEARRAAQALAASESRGRHQAAVLNSAGEGIIAIDCEGRCTSANPAAAQMVGYEVSELLGRDMHALLHHSYPDGSPYPTEQCRMREAARSGQRAQVDSEVFWRRDGSRLPVAYQATPLTDGGRRQGAVVSFTDVSAVRAAKEELERDAARLRRAIRQNELVLHYQPQVEIARGGCATVEALVRWRRGDALVYPDAFIGLAERTGVIGELTQWVIQAAADQALRWRQQGLDLTVAVNVSGLLLGDSHLVQSLVQATGQRGLPPSTLQVELTESALTEEPEAVISVIAELSALGIHTAIDDFGTGYSSLSYLKHLPVAELKIDKSFVVNMAVDSRDEAIVAAVVGLAGSLGLRTVAEGVESDCILRLLRRQGCDVGQGYLWSRPLAAAELTRWLRGRQRTAS